MRLRGRSLMAFALAPTLPIHQWIAQLDEWTRNSPNFFAGRPIVLDLAGVAIAFSEIAQLITTLAARGIRVMGIEGADPNQLSPSLPPLLQGGRSNPGRDIIATASDSGCIAGSSEQRDPKSLLIDTPIRSGQSVAFPSGDVTVLGSVSSGAEIVAGGSIHVYGALRGRAMAGATGNARARIFCTRNEAELVSVNGYYRTAEQIDATLRSRPTQCWLEDRAVSIAALD
ncbi:MAG: septum formation inhibitor MinC [Alphaproteobacteria bacterium]|nr:MAG: septum formation inhibitor MinC [Alphaproteobacteria bacterium]